eukprot:gene11317-19831_t
MGVIGLGSSYGRGIQDELMATGNRIRVTKGRNYPKRFILELP